MNDLPLVLNRYERKKNKYYQRNFFRYDDFLFINKTKQKKTNLKR